MIDRSHELPVARQAQVLKLSRSCVYDQARLVSAADLAIILGVQGEIDVFRRRQPGQAQGPGIKLRQKRCS